MFNLHESLVEHIRKKCEEAGDETLVDQSNEELYKQWFLNFRYQNGQPRGMRLTDHGLMYFKSHFKFWEHKLTDLPLTNAKKIWLDRFLVLPYHFGSGYLTLFEKQAAMQLKLVDNSIEAWMAMTEQGKSSFIS